MTSSISIPPYAGIVEGFYSRPLATWDREQRLETLAFLQQFAPAVNSYFYCPKDDPYVIERWAEHYPREAFQPIREVIRYSGEHGLTFVYGFNPALPEPGHQPEAVRLQWVLQVQHKLEQLLLENCGHFCLLFDDLPLSYDAIDKELGLQSSGIEEFFVDLINTLYNNVREKIAALWVCAPDYCFYEETALTRAMRGLDRRIGVVWTGRGVFVNKFSLDDVERVDALLGADVPLIYWSNYPVNDVEQNLGVFNLGAYYPPGTKESSSLSAMFANPMRQCFANLPFYMSFSDFLREPNAYRRAESWERALVELLGENYREAAFLFEEFSSCNMIDGAPKWMLRELRQKAGLEAVLTSVARALEIAATPPCRPEGRKFLGAVDQVLADARRFLEIGRRLMRAEPVTAEDFILQDWFPTDPAPPRNLPEILRIVNARIEHAPASSPAAFEVLGQYRPLAADFEQRYRGRQKLAIEPADRERYRRAIHGLIRADQMQMLETLNDSRLSAEERLAAFALRQSISRFTLPQYEPKRFEDAG